jgi:hypothetical protein
MSQEEIVMENVLLTNPVLCKHLRVLVSKLVVEVLNGLLKDVGADLWEFHFAQLRFSKRPCAGNWSGA